MYVRYGDSHPEYSAPQGGDGPHNGVPTIPWRKRIFAREELLFNYFRGAQINPIKIVPGPQKSGSPPYSYLRCKFDIQ
jgi:hypothetical protein